MIQEIYDYLWIRSYLMHNDIDFILKDIEKNDSYTDIVKIISNLMQIEDYLLTYNSLQDKVNDIIMRYRFNYNHDKEINDEMNYIIKRLNDYKRMDSSKKVYLIRNFYDEECKSRNLPIVYKSVRDQLDNFIAADGNCFVKTFFIHNDQENEQTVYDRYEVMPVCAMSNLLANKYPEYYYNQDAREMMLEVINAFRTFKGLTLIEKQYMNKTERNVKKIGAR